jgi:hypothetical protein
MLKERVKIFEFSILFVRAGVVRVTVTNKIEISNF